MTLPPSIRATLAELERERHPDADEDIHFTEGLARTAIESLTEPGDLVLDPFAGFGTTLAVAHACGRRSVGVELLPERVAAIASRVPDAVVVEGDARGLLTLTRDDGGPLADPGSVALALTSPPYMTATDHPENPLAAYETDDGDYRTYLRELASVVGQVRELLRPGGHLVLSVADIDHAGHRTPLVADVTAAAMRSLDHVATVPVIWDTLPHDLVDDRMVVLRRAP